MTYLAAKKFNFETALDKYSMKKNNVGAQVNRASKVLPDLCSHSEIFIASIRR